MNEMKPCPFCGGRVELRPKMDGRDETYFILCTKCDMWFEKFVYRAWSPRTIIEEWNRRYLNGIPLSQYIPSEECLKNDPFSGLFNRPDHAYVYMDWAEAVKKVKE